MELDRRCVEITKVLLDRYEPRFSQLVDSARSQAEAVHEVIARHDASMKERYPLLRALSVGAVCAREHVRWELFGF